MTVTFIIGDFPLISRIGVYHAGLFSLTSNSRMMFGFARDRGLPPLFRRVDSSGTPVYTIWLAAFLAFCLALPSLGSSVGEFPCTLPQLNQTG